MINADLLERILGEGIEQLYYHFFPQGRKVGQEWKLANTSGQRGDSLGIGLARFAWS